MKCQAKLGPGQNFIERQQGSPFTLTLSELEKSEEAKAAGVENSNLHLMTSLSKCPCYTFLTTFQCFHQKNFTNLCSEIKGSFFFTFLWQNAPLCPPRSEEHIYFNHGFAQKDMESTFWLAEYLKNPDWPPVASFSSKFWFVNRDEHIFSGFYIRMSNGPFQGIFGSGLFQRQNHHWMKNANVMKGRMFFKTLSEYLPSLFGKKTASAADWHLNFCNTNGSLTFTIFVMIFVKLCVTEGAARSLAGRQSNNNLKTKNIRILNKPETSFHSQMKFVIFGVITAKLMPIFCGIQAKIYDDFENWRRFELWRLFTSEASPVTSGAIW